MFTVLRDTPLPDVLSRVLTCSSHLDVAVWLRVLDSSPMVAGDVQFVAKQGYRSLMTDYLVLDAEDASRAIANGDLLDAYTEVWVLESTEAATLKPVNEVLPAKLTTEGEDYFSEVSSPAHQAVCTVIERLNPIAVVANGYGTAVHIRDDIASATQLS